MPAGSEPGRWGSSGSCPGFCRGSGYGVMGSITGGGDKSREPICTRKVDGPAQAYWQALLAGDQGAVAQILSDPHNNLSPDAVFDTSDLEEWKNYRFNFRGLSMWGGSGRARTTAWLSRGSEPSACAAGRCYCWGRVLWVLFGSLRSGGGNERAGMWSGSPVLLVECAWSGGLSSVRVPGPSSRGCASAWKLPRFPCGAGESQAPGCAPSVTGPAA